MDIPNLFLLIAGGDGTVCSVMNYVKTFPKWAQQNPPAAILPLGTGNDLSRSLGWGGSAQEINVPELLMEYYSKGKNELLDRWKMITNSQEQTREFTIYNYIGIGLDAKICRDFHQIREKYPQLFFSQFSNKIIYTQIGTVDIFKDGFDLSKIFEMKVDGKLINIQGYENIIFLNISNWGGGVTELWKSDSDKHFVTESFSDGIIEVIGLTDVIHMGQVQVGMDLPFQIAQGKVIEIRSFQENKVIPLQIDGQPLEFMSPLQIKIQRKDQINVLATSSTENGKVINILRQGLKQKIIDNQQYEKLLSLCKKQRIE